jgi:ribonucleoside-diphosphate reductase alpha chain
MKYSNNALTIYKRLYFTQEENTPKQVHSRVARAIGNNEEEVVMFEKVMNEGAFKPSTPILINTGIKGKNPWDNQFSACFVIGLEDSMESIIDMWSISAKIFAGGSGVGIPITNLREKGSPIGNTSGHASGPLAYQKVVETVAQTVLSGGRRRRAAILHSARYNHPDIMSIINAKKNGELQSCNISILVDDYFMDLIVKNIEGNYDTKIDLISPNKNKKIGEVFAVELWTEIINNAWATGDPGLLFEDTANKFNLLHNEIGKVESTNPCVTGDTLVLTNKGYIEIQKLVDQPTIIWNGIEWSEVTPKITGENQPVIKIKFSDGSFLKCTPYHKFKLINENKEAKNLIPGDKLEKNNFPVIHSGIDYENAYTQGVFSGDGTYKRGKPCIWLYHEKKKLFPYLNCISSNENNGRIDVFLNEDDMLEKNFVPDTTWSVKSRLDFLAGLIDTDGNSCKDGSIQISSVDKSFLKKIKYMLNTLGISCVLNKSHKRKKKFLPTNKGNETYKLYQCKSCFRINISGSYVIKLIELGLKTYRVKCDYLPTRESKRFIKIISIEKQNKLENKVYCFTEPKNNTGIFNGVYTMQCGEVPLPPWSVCCLGSINLNECLITDDLKPISNYYFDYDKLKKYTKIGTIFLDNVIDKSEYPDEKFKEMSLRTRPIGLGLMGFSDILFKLNISYNSDRARDLFASICKCMNNTAIETSIDMCKNGKQPIAIKNAVDYGYFVHILEHYGCSHKTISDFHKYGIRNSTWTSIAPTGSISIATDCSYSFEPCFALVYEKKLVETNEVLYVINPIFEKWLNSYFPLSNPLFDLDKQRIIKNISENKGSCHGVNGIPEEIQKIFVTAHDILPMEKLQMQAVGQKWISLGISSTCNLPCEATIEDVEKIFIQAWRAGLKGITVYRDGCKENQPISFGKTIVSSEELHEKLLAHKAGVDTIIKDDPYIEPTEKQKKSTKEWFSKLVIDAAERQTEKYERPIRSTADHFEYKTPYGKLHIEICKDDNGKIFQTLIRIGKQGSLTNMLLDSLSRCISLALQEGVDLKVFAKTLRENKEVPFWVKLQKEDETTTQVESIVDLIGIVFQMVLQGESIKITSVEINDEFELENAISKLVNTIPTTKCNSEIFSICPQCNELGLSHALGCKSGQCVLCGYSTC